MHLAACLKLLPAEELEHLDFPMDKVPADPIKLVIYTTKANPAYVDENMPFEQHSEATRFNLFTGNQTLKQRDESFKVVDLHLAFGDYLFTYEISYVSLSFFFFDNLLKHYLSGERRGFYPLWFLQ